jgi:heme a synthase
MSPLTARGALATMRTAMDLMQRRLTWLRRLAWLSAALVLAVASLSAFIRVSHAGLGCSDWPQCYGERLRDAQRGRADAAADSPAVAAARLAHRLVASSALLLVIALVVLSFGNAPWLKREGTLALALLALALALAVLGRWTAGARVPAVAVGNLLGGMLMLALCVRLAAPPAPAAGPRPRLWARAAVLVLLAQLALGAVVSASYAGLSCGGLGDCLGRAAAAGWPWQALDPWREPVFRAGALPINAAGALAQAAHRGGALLVLAVLLPPALAGLRVSPRRDGVVLLALLALQIGLGVLMVSASLPLAAALAHNLVAALLLAAVFRMT